MDMALRVIWQYMDRSVTQKILDGPVHILPYDPQCHELFAIYTTSEIPVNDQSYWVLDRYSITILYK